MAGDWLKFEKATLDKPEVFEMAGILGIDPDAVIGKLLRVWDWFDDQSTDGYAPVALAAQLNRNTGCPEFTAAMQKAGWLIIEGEKLSIPNFHRHNGQTAKDRALSAKRMAKSRGKSYADSVTPTATKTQPEKRREEKNSSTQMPTDDARPLCTLEQALSYAPTARLTPEQATFWWHTRNASGWTKGTQGGGAGRKITSFQSDMQASSSNGWIAEAMAKASGSKPKEVDTGNRKRPVYE